MVVKTIKSFCLACLCFSVIMFLSLGAVVLLSIIIPESSIGVVIAILLSVNIVLLLCFLTVDINKNIFPEKG